MNFSKGALRRYKIIDGILRNPYRKYPSLEQILDGCNEKLSADFSLETISKDLKHMRSPFPDGFDAPIKYCHYNRGYHYTDPDYSFTGISLRPQELDAIQEALDVIRAFGGARISENFNHALEKLLSTTLENEAGQEALIHFSYTQKLPGVSQYKHHIIHPFLIKEFENRWYVIGYSEQHDSMRTFGLDQITGPVLLRRKYLQTDKEVRKSFLCDVYGVYPVPEAVKEKITIAVGSNLTYYFEGYPLHETQVIQKHHAGDSTITFELIPSVELARFFLSHGRHLTVIKPAWFKTFIQNLRYDKNS